MSEVPFDVEKLARGLEIGIASVESWFDTGQNDILRTPRCGLASSAIARYFSSEGYETGILINKPKLKNDPNAAHVISSIIIDDQKLFIDATYSQFFDYAGLSPWHPGSVMPWGYPEQKIIVFSREEVPLFTRSMAERASRFMEIEKDRPTVLNRLEGIRPERFRGMTIDEMQAIYMKIWDTDKYRALEPKGTYFSTKVDDVVRSISANMQTLEI